MAVGAKLHWHLGPSGSWLLSYEFGTMEIIVAQCQTSGTVVRGQDGFSESEYLNNKNRCIVYGSNSFMMPLRQVTVLDFRY